MKKLLPSVMQWFANDKLLNTRLEDQPDTLDWIRIIPFFILNLSCLLVFWVGFSWTAFITALVVCYFRVFSIGAFYHRYFSHRAYKTNRFWQFIFAILGSMAVQRGPLWWAGHHRRHHAFADQETDAHSPIQHGFLWSHVGWFLSKRNYYYNSENIKDLLRYPELIFLEKYDVLIPMILAVALFLFGLTLQKLNPSLGTNGFQMLIWGFSISTFILFNITVSINSFAHKYGRRVYNTKDHSRNNWLLALITLGEGWHNNHHYYPSSVRQGFHFWQIDITYYFLCLFEKLGIIWDLKRVPKELINKNQA